MLGFTREVDEPRTLPKVVQSVGDRIQEVIKAGEKRIDDLISKNEERVKETMATIEIKPVAHEQGDLPQNPQEFANELEQQVSKYLDEIKQRVMDRMRELKQDASGAWEDIRSGLGERVEQVLKKAPEEGIKLFPPPKEHQLKPTSDVHRVPSEAFAPESGDKLESKFEDEQQLAPQKTPSAQSHLKRVPSEALAPESGDKLDYKYYSDTGIAGEAQSNEYEPVEDIFALKQEKINLGESDTGPQESQPQVPLPDEKILKEDVNMILPVPIEDYLTHKDEQSHTVHDKSGLPNLQSKYFESKRPPAPIQSDNKQKSFDFGEQVSADTQESKKPPAPLSASFPHIGTESYQNQEKSSKKGDAKKQKNKGEVHEKKSKKKNIPKSEKSPSKQRGDKSIQKQSQVPEKEVEKSTSPSITQESGHPYHNQGVGQKTNIYEGARQPQQQQPQPITSVEGGVPKTIHDKVDASVPPQSDKPLSITGPQQSSSQYATSMENVQKPLETLKEQKTRSDQSAFDQPLSHRMAQSVRHDISASIGPLSSQPYTSDQQGLPPLPSAERLQPTDLEQNKQDESGEQMVLVGRGGVKVVVDYEGHMKESQADIQKQLLGQGDRPDSNLPEFSQASSIYTLEKHPELRERISTHEQQDRSTLEESLKIGQASIIKDILAVTRAEPLEYKKEKEEVHEKKSKKKNIPKSEKSPSKQRGDKSIQKQSQVPEKEVEKSTSPSITQESGHPYHNQGVGQKTNIYEGARQPQQQQPQPITSVEGGVPKTIHDKVDASVPPQSDKPLSITGPQQSNIQETNRKLDTQPTEEQPQAEDFKQDLHPIRLETSSNQNDSNTAKLESHKSEMNASENNETNLPGVSTSQGYVVAEGVESNLDEKLPSSQSKPTEIEETPRQAGVPADTRSNVGTLPAKPKIGGENKELKEKLNESSETLQTSSNLVSDEDTPEKQEPFKKEFDLAQGDLTSSKDESTSEGPAASEGRQSNLRYEQESEGREGSLAEHVSHESKTVNQMENVQILPQTEGDQLMIDSLKQQNEQHEDRDILSEGSINAGGVQDVESSNLTSSFIATEFKETQPTILSEGDVPPQGGIKTEEAEKEKFSYAEIAKRES